jgi:hypothetical protein
MRFRRGSGSFSDHDRLRSAAGKKLALKRSDNFPGGRSAAASWCPEKSPIEPHLKPHSFTEVADLKDQ